MPYSRNTLQPFMANIDIENLNPTSKKIKIKIKPKNEQKNEVNNDPKNETVMNQLPSPPLLSVDNWKYTKAFTESKRKETQTQYYVRMNAAPEVIELVSLDSKPFGSVSESILTELFQMTPRTSSQHDGIFEGHKCEIKCARYWERKDDCRWQHLEPDHDYDFAMLALLDFHKWNVWCISKAHLMGELREKKVVTFQGKQGWWTLKSAIMPYLTQIQTPECLQKFVSTIPK